MKGEGEVGLSVALDVCIEQGTQALFGKAKVAFFLEGLSVGSNAFLDVLGGVGEISCGKLLVGYCSVLDVTVHD